MRGLVITHNFLKDNRVVQYRMSRLWLKVDYQCGDSQSLTWILKDRGQCMLREESPTLENWTITMTKSLIAPLKTSPKTVKRFKTINSAATQ